MMTSTTPPHRGLQGVWPALLTPFTDGGHADHAKLVAHARRLLDAGCPGVTPFGTTGEGTSFTLAERRAGVEALVAGGIPGPRLLISTSCAALPDAIELTRHAQDLDAWGVLLMPPFYFKGIGDDAVIDAITRIVDATAARPLRVVLYHIPQVSGVALSAAAIAELLRRHGERIVAIKDSAGDLAHSLALAETFMTRPPRAARIGVHVGHEPHLPALGRLGSGGAVSGLANYMPRTVHRLVNEPDSAAARADLARVERLLPMLGHYGVIPAVKAIQAMQHGDDPAWRRARSPLLALPDDRYAALARDLAPLALDADQD